VLRKPIYRRARQRPKSHQRKRPKPTAAPTASKETGILACLFEPDRNVWPPVGEAASGFIPFTTPTTLGPAADMAAGAARGKIARVTGFLVVAEVAIDWSKQAATASGRKRVRRRNVGVADRGPVGVVVPQRAAYVQPVLRRVKAT